MNTASRCGARFIVAVGVAAISGLSSVVLAQDVPTLAVGAFSEAQVRRGEESFAWECMDCHEIEEFTGVGAYLEDMQGDTLWDVFEFVWSEMPEDRPAWLDPEEYADILAYILSVYGHPTGPSDLPIDEKLLEKIEITAPERPGS